MPRRPDDDGASSRSTARLSRDMIVEAGIALADRDGLDGLSMRRLGQELRVHPMSLYHHVRDKEALLEAMVDAIVARIAPDHPGPGDPAKWATELRSLIRAARLTMLAHPWAVPVIQQRQTPTPASLLHIERLLAVLRGGGFSVDLSHHALHVLGSRMLGFSQDLFSASATERSNAGDTSALPRAWADTYPHVVELAAAASHDGGLGGCDDEEEFDFSLDVLLDGLERRLAEAIGH
jgi:AcrR family transcriptional regulator